jgi:hypothetical protein
MVLISRRALDYEKTKQAVYLKNNAKVTLPALAKTSAVVESLHSSFILGAVHPNAASS